MSAYLTALTGAGTVVATGLTVMARIVRPSGRHRATAANVPLAEPMPGWPAPVYGAVVPQAFRHCRGCRGDAPVTLHPGAHTCAAGHVTITSIGGNR